MSRSYEKSNTDPQSTTEMATQSAVIIVILGVLVTPLWAALLLWCLLRLLSI